MLIIFLLCRLLIAMWVWCGPVLRMLVQQISYDPSKPETVDVASQVIDIGNKKNTKPGPHFLLQKFLFLIALSDISNTFVAYSNLRLCIYAKEVVSIVSQLEFQLHLPVFIMDRLNWCGSIMEI